MALEAGGLLKELEHETRALEEGKGSTDAAEGKLRELKRVVLMALSGPTASPEERTIARSTLECAVIVAACARDDGAMERAWAQLAVYYSDRKG